MEIRIRMKVLTLALLLLGLSISQAEDTVNNDVAMMAVTQASDYVSANDDAIIVDVRTPAEFTASHITDAVNINVQDESFESLVVSLDRDKTYIVHCTKNPADGRSSRALQTLKELGFNNLYSLEGGYIAWKDAELPLTEAQN